VKDKYWVKDNLLLRFNIRLGILRIIYILLFVIIIICYFVSSVDFYIIRNTIYILDNFVYTIQIDGLSLLFMGLSTFLLLISFYGVWHVRYRFQELIVVLVGMYMLLVQLFWINDVFIFYILFEGLIIPMFLLIGIWGTRVRKINAAYIFLIYTLVGSLLMLAGFIVMFSHSGSLEMQVNLFTYMSVNRQKIIACCFILPFVIKVPLIPMHKWLPEAHVEASTLGSVFLAGIIMKIGCYGMLRFVIFICYGGVYYYAPLVISLSLLGSFYGAVIVLFMYDIKKIIAFSSVVHMNLINVGIFSFNVYGIEGAFIGLISHTLISSGLFFSVGFLYKRFKTRLLNYYSGLMYFMPLYATCVFLLLLGNVAFPGTLAFISEVLLISGVYFKFGFLAIYILFITFVLSVVLSFRLYNRLFCGYVKWLVNDRKFFDLSGRELLILLLLIVFLLYWGMFSIPLYELLPNLYYISN